MAILRVGPSTEADETVRVKAYRLATVPLVKTVDLDICLLKTAFRLHFAAQTVRLPTWRHEVRGHPGAVRPGALDGDIALEGIEIAVAYIVVSETDDMGYRAIGRTGKKSTRELIDELDFTKAGDLSYLDSQFRAIVEPLHDWIFARNLLSIFIRIGGLYRSGADPDTILEAARFRQVNPMVLKKRFDIDTDTCYAIPIAFNPIYRMENLADKDISFDALQFYPLYGSLIDKKNSFSRTAIEQHLKGPGNEFVKFLAPLEASRVKNRSDNHESHSGENKWRYMVVSSKTNADAINSQMQLANRLLQAFDGILSQPQLAYTGIKMAEIAPERKPSNILEAMWLLVRNHPGYYFLTCKRCMRTVLSGTQGGDRSFCSNSCRATWSKEHSVK